MRNKKDLNFFDRIMIAITFAEKNEPETALEMLSPTQQGKQKRVSEKKQADQRPVLRV